MRSLTLTVAGLVASLVLVPAARAADACDGLAARVVRVTGASVAGRSGSLVVFRAGDAERMSLDCGSPRRMVFGALDREPVARFYDLVGAGAAALTGARGGDAAVLARVLQQDSLLADAPRRGVLGPAAIRCATGPRTDELADLRTVCVVAPSRPSREPARLPPVRAKG